jgi:hypothetical protein
MRTMLVAAVSLGLGVSAAYADGGQGTVPNTFFTELPGAVAQAPVLKAPSTEAAKTRQQDQASSQAGHGPWLFPPIGKYLDQQAGG